MVLKDVRNLQPEAQLSVVELFRDEQRMFTKNSTLHDSVFEELKRTFTIVLCVDFRDSAEQGRGDIDCLR